MSKIYPYCKALRFNGETMGMGCASEKVKLPLLAAPPKSLKTLLTGTTSKSKRFLSQIRKYSSCFQMTSFGAAVSTCVELDCEQSYSTSDLLSYVQNNVSKLMSE